MTRFVPVSGYRSTVDSVPGGIDISIPSQRNYFVAAFLACWLGGWFFGESNAIRELMSPSADKTPSAFLFFWLCGWTLGGCFATVTLLWNLAGRERVTVQHDAFSIRREAFGIGFAKNYQLSVVKELRAVDSVIGTGPFGGGGRSAFGYASARLAFDYGAQTVRFGAGVDMAEAKYLLAKIAAAKPTLSISPS